MKSTSNREIRALTSLRAIAAGLVFFYHFIYLRHPAPANTLIDAILQNGFIGVSIFFVLSGFVLTLRYMDEVRSNTFSWGMYIKRRIARIYPVYFFLLAGIALWGVPLNITNFTLTQGFFTKYWQTGIISTWSLTVEECFYLLLPFILLMLVRTNRLPLMVLVLLGWTFAMLGIGLLLVQWSSLTGTARQSGFMATQTFMLYRTVFGYIFDFSVGIFFAILYKRYGTLGVKRSTLLTLIGLAGIIGCQWVMRLYRVESIEVRLLMYLVAAFTGVMMFGLTCERVFLSKVLAWSPLVYMGRISYAVYLLQLTQLVWFMAGWPVVLFYIGVNVLSAGLYQFVEEPARKLILGHKLRLIPAFGYQIASRKE